MVEVPLNGQNKAMILPQIQEKLGVEIADNSAFIIVDDLDHLVRGRLGRPS